MPGLRAPSAERYGDLDGAVLLGLTGDGKPGPGEFLWARFEGGKLVELESLVDPSTVKGRFELMLPGDPEPDRLMDVRAVAKTGTIVPPAGVLEVLKSREIVLGGDEAFFIRFTTELLTLLAEVFGP